MRLSVMRVELNVLTGEILDPSSNEELPMSALEADFKLWTESG